MTVEVKQLVIKSNIDNSSDRDQIDMPEADTRQTQMSSVDMEALRDELRRMCKSLILSELKRMRER